MTITAKYAATCPCCNRPINVGDRIEWSKGTKARHAACAAVGAPVSSARPRRGGGTWDPSRFNGYGAPRGGFVRACKSGGNCSSFGTGRSCGGHDCDGF